jgi:LysM repeat protein
MGKQKKIQEQVESVDFITVNEFISEEIISEQEQEYKVQAGDNLEKIGNKFNKDWKQIAEDNEIEAPYELFINQKLIIK